VTGTATRHGSGCWAGLGTAQKCIKRPNAKWSPDLLKKSGEQLAARPIFRRERGWLKSARAIHPPRPFVRFVSYLFPACSGSRSLQHLSYLSRPPVPIEIVRNRGRHQTRAAGAAIPPRPLRAVQSEHRQLCRSGRGGRRRPSRLLHSRCWPRSQTNRIPGMSRWRTMTMADRNPKFTAAYLQGHRVV